MPWLRWIRFCGLAEEKRLKKDEGHFLSQKGAVGLVETDVPALPRFASPPQNVRERTLAC